jgi:FkbM family methyltransferase
MFLKFGYEIRKYPNPFAFQKLLLSGVQAPIIFDAGAHRGYITTRYHRLFPAGTIYAFEPFPESFSILEKTQKTTRKIHPLNLALSNKTGRSVFHANFSAATNSLLPTDLNAQASWPKGQLDTIKTISVETTTLDDFCDKHDIDHIDLLKMDVQGAEYLILEGAKNLLSQGKIGLIYTEILISPSYEGQINFYEFLERMHTAGFDLYGIYNISPPKGQIKQIDAIFIKRQPAQK